MPTEVDSGRLMPNLSKFASCISAESALSRRRKSSALIGQLKSQHPVTQIKNRQFVIKKQPHSALTEPRRVVASEEDKEWTKE
jgi:hypothetical protein